ncbi:Bacterial Ig-like domain (group 2) [compost metagenome]
MLVVDDASDYRLAIDLRVGQSSRLTIDDYTFSKFVEWVSLDQSVATVSSKGKVKAIAEGLTIISAKDEQGQVVGQIYVRVRE